MTSDDDTSLIRETDSPADEAAGFGACAVRCWRAAAGVLGWRPDEFWRATPRELADALLPEAAVDGPERATIEALIRRFPDQ